MAERSTEIPVNREDDLHLRPMQVLVERAGDFEAALTLKRGMKQADAKSILDVMMLAAEKGPLFLHADGPDAHEAVEALEGLLHDELNKG